MPRTFEENRFLRFKGTDYHIRFVCQEGKSSGVPCCKCGDPHHTMRRVIQILALSTGSEQITVAADTAHGVIKFVQDRLHHSQVLCSKCFWSRVRTLDNTLQRIL